MMTLRFSAIRRSAPRHQGFTLVEVLVAIIILLVGVVAALRIFPRGFDAYTESQQTNVAIKQMERTIEAYRDNPEMLPEWFAPVDMSMVPSANTAITQSFFEDLTAVEFLADSAAGSWYSAHLYPNDTWPLWEPMSARIMRRVVGERILIPAEFTQVTGASAVNIAFVPKYVPTWSPLQSNAANTADIVTIYDLRYRKVAEDELRNLADQLDALQDTLYYTVNYEKSVIKLLPSTEDRAIRFTFYAMNKNDKNADGSPKLLQVAPATAVLPAAGGAVTFTTTDGQTVATTATLGNGGIYLLTLDDPWQLVSGSEQLNRAYRLDESITSPSDFDAIAALKSGYYYLATPPNGGTNRMLLDAIFFSREDAGRTVKMDYTLADWNILHEELTPDAEGYVTTAVPDLKVANQPAFPREPYTWGLYLPMKPVPAANRRPPATWTPAVWEQLKEQSAFAVLGLLDIRTGAAYHVYYDPYHVIPANPNLGWTATREKNWRLQTYKVMPANPFATQTLPGQPEYVDLSQAPRGRIRLGVGTDDPNRMEIDWTRLHDTTYRFFYRARRDWTLQVYKPPAMFWFLQPAGDLEAMNLGWDKFSCKLADDDPQVRRAVAVPGVYAGQSVALDYSYRRVPNDVNSPLLQVNGEVHTIPMPVAGKLASTVLLEHAPAKNTLITVRGVSVTVRALWAQPRSGMAYQVQEGDALTMRTLNSRWQGKSATVVLSTTKE